MLRAYFDDSCFASSNAPGARVRSNWLRPFKSAAIASNAIVGVSILHRCSDACQSIRDWPAQGQQTRTKFEAHNLSSTYVFFLSAIHLALDRLQLVRETIVASLFITKLIGCPSLMRAGRKRISN